MRWIVDSARRPADPKEAPQLLHDEGRHERDGEPKSSDQMPEEAPAEAVIDDDPAADEGAARESGRRQVRDVAGAHRPGAGRSPR